MPSIAKTHSPFGSDYKEYPYWWDHLEKIDLTGLDIKRQAEVVIIGSGYTALSTALTLSRSGIDVLILEAKTVGYGASTRNAGMVSGVLKHTFKQLKKKYGSDNARNIFKHSQKAVLFLEELIKNESIECQYVRSGMYFAACHPSHYLRMKNEAEELTELGIELSMVPEDQQCQEVGSSIYHGGRILKLAGSLHPGQLHQGLVNACLSAGVKFAEHTEVINMSHQGDDWNIDTSKGRFNASEVVVATNGYTGSPFTYAQRRIIPIASYIVVTEPLPEETIKKIIPGNKMIQDTKRVLSYYRTSPDGTRILFGGRTSFRKINLRESAVRLHEMLAHVFPELNAVKLSHSWSGNVAFTFDALPHYGNKDGLHFSLGYCGQGVAMSIYLGHCLAESIVDGSKSTNAFSTIPFPGRPAYTGNPWFLPVVGEVYRLLDRFGI